MQYAVNLDFLHLQKIYTFTQTLPLVSVIEGIEGIQRTPNLDSVDIVSVNFLGVGAGITYFRR